jgi:hypothetical protein
VCIVSIVSTAMAVARGMLLATSSRSTIRSRAAVDTFMVATIMAISKPVHIAK